MVKKFIKSVKSVLFADPELLFKDECGLVNQPFLFEGGNGKAVLLIHGWTSTPYEVRRLGKYLNENGYTVCAPMLSGHGTVPQDLENVKWEDWDGDVKRAYEGLKKNHKKVYIGGTSIGASLAIRFAEDNPDVSGLILMATPYRLKTEWWVVFFARFLRLFKKYNRKFYPPTFGVSTTITRLISYQTYPIDSALETFELIRKSRGNLESVKQPCFIIQSSHDHIVTKNSLEIIYGKINSPIKKKKYIRRAYHTFISDIKNEHIFKDILNFIDSL